MRGAIGESMTGHSLVSNEAGQFCAGDEWRVCRLSRCYELVFYTSPTRPPALNRAALSAGRVPVDAARLASVKSHSLRAHPFGSTTC